MMQDDDSNNVLLQKANDNNRDGVSDSNSVNKIDDSGCNMSSELVKLKELLTAPFVMYNSHTRKV